MRLSTGLDRLVSVLERDDPAARSRAQSTSAGAAGGLGFGLVHFAGGALVSGSAWVLDRLGFDGLLAEADVVVTGEGAFDSTSLEGKLTGEVVRRAQAAGVPVALVAPRAAAVPPGVVVESGQGQWSAEDVARAAERALRRVLRLPLS
jgi:glycerate kinase